MPKFLTINQTAEILGFSRDWVYRKISSDTTFPAKRIGGRWRIQADMLQAWIESQKGSGPAYSNRNIPGQQYQLNIPKQAHSPF